MVRFSCFAAHIPSTKSKKTSQLSAEMMHKASEEHSEVQSFKDLENSSGATPLHLKVHEDSVSITSNHVTNFASIQRNWKSEEVKLPFQNESCVGVYKSRIHRSKSVGSGLHQNQSLSCGNESENETGQSVFSERSHDQSSSVISVGNKNPEPYPTDWCPEAPPASLHGGSGMVNDESIFLIGDPEQFEKGEKHENSDTQYSGQYAGESSNHSLHTPRIISKSRSLPNVFVFDGHSTTTHLLRRAASCENLDVLYSKRQEMFGAQIIQDVERDNDVKYNVENPADDCFDAYNHVGIAKDWIVPVMDEINPVNNPQAEPLFRSWEDLPSKDFKIKRIEEWISALESCSRFEEKHELSTSSDEQADAGVTVFDVSSTGKQDGKITPGMEAAKRYVSSLSATATSAQLCNHGLVVIPFLSTFVSLKELNLSGNAIARITAGALPRGLHILNLSKNNISTIEGLRELTRLRVLDLSYNRILRIGHGLASCSSVKQLYLAGNKISEVEGLHRLLKLNVLDLRFNKISTAKCLGQLAANYNSLQAISLEGNPAQKNVGDEQLKKYLQSLLPHLAYFNRQSIKAGALKDSADRSARLGISSHQIDRSLRSELKRKGNHGLSAHKRQSSSIHSRRCQHSQQAVALPKLPRDRQRRLAPSGIKTNVRPRVHDFGSKMLSFRPDLVLQRSHSEGNLGAH